MKVNDITSGILFLFFGVVLWLAANNLPNPANQIYGPAFFPKCIAGMIMLSAIIMIANSRNQIGNHPFLEIASWTSDKRIIAQFLAIPVMVVVFFSVVEIVGFLLSGAVVLLALLLVFRERLLVALPITIGVIAAIYLIFVMLLRVPLPHGSLL